MSDYTKTWLTEWVGRRVTAGPFLQQKRLATETYAPACLSEAAKAGITRRELEAAADGSLVAFIENAIEDKMDIEVRKNRPA
ncbi:MAG TPA: hypothetical protein VHZ78_14850 [Rhizomicrobium sp.]|jgi:hypothetical protein|nr:hypothetical protein [Rhizomicrobium sp.]